MSTKRRLSLTSSAHKLKLDSVNKIIKFDKSRKQKNEAINKEASRVALAELIKNSPMPLLHCQPPDFRTFLTVKENVTVFKEFLETQYCQENLDFYLRCENYRNLDPKGVGKELVKFYATQIYNDYLSENARQPVNVNNTCVQIIKSNLKDPKPDLFEDAQSEIFELLRVDCFPRFCKSWELDRKLAQKILSDSFQTNKSGCVAQLKNNNITISTHTLNSLSTSNSSFIVPRGASMKPSARLTNTSDTTNSTVSDCPPECPYFLVGRLPCQGHKRRSPRLEARERKRLFENHTDPKKIHKPTKQCELKNGSPTQLSTSPPPPLPPKPDNLDLRYPSNRRYRPYVGRVFNV